MYFYYVSLRLRKLHCSAGMFSYVDINTGFNFLWRCPRQKKSPYCCLYLCIIVEECPYLYHDKIIICIKFHCPQTPLFIICLGRNIGTMLYFLIDENLSTEGINILQKNKYKQSSTLHIIIWLSHELTNILEENCFDVNKDASFCTTCSTFVIQILQYLLSVCRDLHNNNTII